MDRKKTLTVSGAFAFVACAVSIFLIHQPTARNSPREVDRPPAINPTVAASVEANLTAIHDLQKQLYGIEPDEVSLPNVAHAIGAFGIDHQRTIGGHRVHTSRWLLEEASHRPLIGGYPAVAEGVSGWQFRRARRIAEFGYFEGHFAQVLFYLSEAIEDPDSHDIQVRRGEAVVLREFVVSLEREFHGIGLDTSYALPVLFRWSSQSGWSNRFGEHWNAGRLLKLHLDREPLQHFCGGAHWCYALAFAIRGEHDQRLPGTVDDAARSRLDVLLREVLESIDGEGRIQWSLQGRGSAVSQPAHELEWVFLAADGRVLAGIPDLHLAVRWLILQTELEFDTLSFRDLSHVARALALYGEAVTSVSPVVP